MDDMNLIARELVETEELYKNKGNNKITLEREHNQLTKNSVENWKMLAYLEAPPPQVV